MNQAMFVQNQVAVCFVPSSHVYSEWYMPTSYAGLFLLIPGFFKSVLLSSTPKIIYAYWYRKPGIARVPRFVQYICSCPVKTFTTMESELNNLKIRRLLNHYVFIMFWDKTEIRKLTRKPALSKLTGSTV